MSTLTENNVIAQLEEMYLKLSADEDQRSISALIDLANGKLCFPFGIPQIKISSPLENNACIFLVTQNLILVKNEAALSASDTKIRVIFPLSPPKDSDGKSLEIWAKECLSLFKQRRSMPPFYSNMPLAIECRPIRYEIDHPLSCLGRY